ncbi:MAG: phosphatase PAP2 family protein [Myxococcales bacterium]
MLRRLLSFDEALLLACRRFHLPRRTKLMNALTHLGDAKSWVLLALTLLALGTPEAQLVALRLGAGAGFATVVAQLLKRVCRRARPTNTIVGFRALAENPDAFSFPSGHTAAAFGVAIALAGAGTGLGPLFAALAAGIGISRVYLGAHYPLDVGIGALLGTCAGLLARVAVG